MKKILTQDFETILIPELSGTEKQISFGEGIRQKYIDIFNKKLNAYNLFDTKGREDFTQKFRDYLNNPVTSSAKYWIDNHCPRCGCALYHEDDISYCTNDFCTFEKDNF